jgi:hypothetical protein
MLARWAQPIANIFCPFRARSKNSFQSTKPIRHGGLGTREKEQQNSKYLQITTTLTALNILSYFAKFADKLWLNY